MNVSPNLLNAPSPAVDASTVRTRSYTPGFSDALGDRKLAFDPAAATSLEVLHFKKEFSDSPAFEAALHARLAAVSHLQHPSLAVAHAVERLEGEWLTLVSKHTAGRRVSELLPKAHGPAFALELLRQVTPALATLQRAGDGMAHGALSPERIVVTREGRLIVVEHVLGSAIEALQLPRQRLVDLGFAVPAGDGPFRFDPRHDMAQLGFIGLALLLGRRLDAADYPEKVPALLDEFVLTAGSPILAAKLRTWLERAMQLSPRSFQSARAAQDAFGDLPDDVDVQVAESVRALPARPLEPHVDAAVVKQESVAREKVPAQMPDSGHARTHADLTARHAAPPPHRASRLSNLVTAGLAVLALGEGITIAILVNRQPAVQVVEVPSPAIPSVAESQNPAVPQPDATVSTPPAAVAPASGVAAVATQPEAALPVAGAAPLPAAGPRFGGVTVSSSIDLQVFKDGKLIGSTAGPIALNEGAHSVELVNDTLGFRLAQTVNVKAGQMASVKIGVPNGRISINAVPWAEVVIDGKPAGETPLANLALPIGTHEIIFRHPQFGERKQTVVVKVDGLTKVAQTLGAPGPQSPGGHDAQGPARGER